MRSLVEHRPDLAVDIYLTSAADAAHPEIADLARGRGLYLHEVSDDIIRAMVRDDVPRGLHDSTGVSHDDASAMPQGAVSPQGVVAVARIPQGDPAEILTELPAEGPLTVVILEEIRDPGNVGTLIRTADAAGADAVLLSSGSTDPYAPKAVRASVGSVLHLPVITGVDLATLLPALQAAQIQRVATSGYAEQSLFTAPLAERIAWIMGNEAHGLYADTADAADLAVHIPLHGGAESLNVTTAAAVCLFESVRRRESMGQ